MFKRQDARAYASNLNFIFDPFLHIVGDCGGWAMLGCAALFPLAGTLFKKAILYSGPFFTAGFSLTLAVLLLMIFQIFKKERIRNLFPDRGNILLLIGLGSG
ncbi:MAG: hypothetical protein ACLFWL_01545 [Candidatus Brocadiia bacterium]